jgi:hypothetical protein
MYMYSPTEEPGAHTYTEEPGSHNLDVSIGFQISSLTEPKFAFTREAFMLTRKRRKPTSIFCVYVLTTVLDSEENIRFLKA